MAYPPPYGVPPGAPPPGFPPRQPMQAPPVGMPPGLDFSAPIIRLGTGGVPDAAPPRPRAGPGSGTDPLGGQRNIERERERMRENMMAAQAPTREELARTIFVGGLGEDMVDDEDIEAILRCAGKLRRWTRVRDADDKKCKFGFAEYEDVDSLEAAVEMFAGGVAVPVKSEVKTEEDEEKKVAKMLVVVDEQSKSYVSEWKSRGREDDNARQFRIDGCKEDLRQCLSAISNASAFGANRAADMDRDGDTATANETEDVKPNVDVVNIPLTLEDELADIPAEQRATVVAEIRAFRDRSNRRDIERLKREEELEQAERNRQSPRINRLASPTPSKAPTGPNGVPVGPRGTQIPGAPAGPKGFRGAQIPQDYVNGVNFVGANGAYPGISREDEDAEESDEELERRRQARREEELERQYLELERRRQGKERSRALAQQREREREAREKAEADRARDQLAKKLKAWNDDEETRIGHDEYYRDRSAWVRRRQAIRDREEKQDARDRREEEREKEEERRRQGEAQGQADDFLAQMGRELGQKAQQPGSVSGGFKISITSAARTKATANQPAPRRAFDDAEGLLADDDAATGSTKRPALKPLTDLSTVPTDLTDEEKREGQDQLWEEVPRDAETLYSWPVQWQYITPQVLAEEIRPFVEKRVVDYLGVQEDFLVDVVVEGLKEKKKAEDLIQELAEGMEDEAEPLIRKVWRRIVFWSEAGARGFA
jgi:hypothetical protein